MIWKPSTVVDLTKCCCLVEVQMQQQAWTLKYRQLLIPFPKGSVAAWIHQQNVFCKKSLFITEPVASICCWCQPACWTNPSPKSFDVSLHGCCSENPPPTPLTLTVYPEPCCVKGVGVGCGRWGWDIRPIVCHINQRDVHLAISQWADGGMNINKAGWQQAWGDCNGPFPPGECPGHTDIQQIEQTGCAIQASKSSQLNHSCFIFRHEK